MSEDLSLGVDPRSISAEVIGPINATAVDASRRQHLWLRQLEVAIEHCAPPSPIRHLLQPCIEPGLPQAMFQSLP